MFDRLGIPVAIDSGPMSITVLYDSQCVLCRRCRHWLEGQATWVPVAFVAASSEEAQRRRPDLPWLGNELVVVGDRGEVWAGAAAFLTCLWATVDYRSWSYRLSGPSFAPMAERFLHAVSSNRSRIGAFVRDDCPDGACRHRVDGVSGGATNPYSIPGARTTPINAAVNAPPLPPPPVRTPPWSYQAVYGAE